MISVFCFQNFSFWPFRSALRTLDVGLRLVAAYGSARRRLLDVRCFFSPWSAEHTPLGRFLLFTEPNSQTPQPAKTREQNGDARRVVPLRNRGDALVCRHPNQ